MSTKIKNANQEFEQVLTLITEARNRVYSKANSELVLLYFNVGKVVSEKVNAGNGVKILCRNWPTLFNQKCPIFQGLIAGGCIE